MERRSLHHGWTARLLTAAPGTPAGVEAAAVAATVPGSIHTDLLAAGLIPDPYLDRNELGLSWIGRCDWGYSSSFEVAPPDGSRFDLVAEGLDTIATVTLNGEEVGGAANMHRVHRFDVAGQLQQGSNRLDVSFSAPLTYAERRQREVGAMPAYRVPYNQIRKMACNFGWDWGPQLATVGIWRPLWLERWSVARLAAVRPRVVIEDGRGRVDVVVELEWAEGDAGPVRVAASVAGGSAATTLSPGERATTLIIEGLDVERWWPRSLGKQPRYDLEVGLFAAGAEIDRWQRRIGFRSVEVDTTAEDGGSRWQLVVNGRPMWTRGANWIPDDCFPARVDRDRYRRRIEQALAANVDLLRVWGGGIYESDDFYEQCDELGVLVWQDFLFACAAYPEDPETTAEVEAEAIDNVTRLMPHPSLALWCGNNENLWGHEDWGWVEELGDRAWGAGFYFDLLPDLVGRLDPGRPYWPGTPYSGPGRHPNDPRHGTSHLWDVWNQLDYTAYRDHRPRFVAEFGFQGPPAWATLRRALSDEPLTVASSGLANHQKAESGMEKLQRRLEEHFPIPSGFDDWHFLTQVNQARAIVLGVEHFRANRHRCSGSIVWQLNDCWPVISWAAVDGDGRRKPLWYALRRAYADRLVTIQPQGDGLAAVAVNDSAEPWRATLLVQRWDMRGVELQRERFAFEVSPGDSWWADLPATTAEPGDAAGELITASAGTLRGWWFWARDRALHYPEPASRVEVERRPDGWDVTVTAAVLLRDVCLFVDRLDPRAEVDEMLVTLLPGETARFRVTSELEIDPVALCSPPVLRCVNDVDLLVEPRPGGG